MRKGDSLAARVIVWLCLGGAIWPFLVAGDIARYLLDLFSSKLANPVRISTLYLALVALGALAVSFAVALKRVRTASSIHQEMVSRWSVPLIILWTLAFGFLLLVNYPVPYQAHHADKFILSVLVGFIWVLWFTLHPVSLDQALHSRLYARIKIGLINVAIFAVVGEATMRVADPVLARSGLFGDKHTPANLKPHSVVRGSISLANSQGFKDRERSFERSESSPRVVAIGDSFTWGAGVSYDETFVTLVERRLQAVAQGAEVINLGVPAWGPHEEFHLLKTYGIRFHSDLVMLNFFIGNDIQNKRGDDVNLPEILVVAGQSYYVHSNGNWAHDVLGPSRWYLYHNLNYLIQVGSLRLQRPSGEQDFKGGVDMPPVVPHERYLRGIHESSDIYLVVDSPYFEHHWNRTKATLLAMRDFLRVNKVPLLIVLIPAPVQLDPVLQAEYLASVNASAQQYDFQKPSRLLRAWCVENEVPVVDLLPAFEAAGSPDRLYFQNDIHWSAEGHKLAAETIAPVLEEQLGLVTTKLQ